MTDTPQTTDPVVEALRHAERVSYDVAQGIEQFLRAIPTHWERPDGQPTRAVYDAEQLADAVAAARERFVAETTAYHCDSCGPVPGFCGLHRCEARPVGVLQTTHKAPVWWLDALRAKRSSPDILRAAASDGFQVTADTLCDIAELMDYALVEVSDSKGRIIARTTDAGRRVLEWVSDAR